MIVDKNKEKILIDKIISDAEAKAAALIRHAKETADKEFRSVKASVAADRQTATAEADRQAAELIGHRLSLCELEISRAGLKARKAAVDRAFSEAARRLFESGGGEYISIISRMIKKYGQDGDVVQRGKGDEKRVTAAAVADIAKALNMKLGFAETAGDFTGGIMLRGGHCDKNLTFETVFKMIREETEPEIAQILFK